MLNDDMEPLPELARGGIVGPVNIPENDGCVIPRDLNPKRVEIRLPDGWHDVTEYVIGELRRKAKLLGGGPAC